MELFDEVDIEDNVIGVTDKPTAHAKGHIHRGVAIFVFDKVGNLYVQLHKASNNRYDNSVGGHVRQGESYDMAAKREGVEELGIIQPLQFVAGFYSETSVSKHMFHLYECVVGDDWHFEPNDEVETIIPMKIADIRKIMIDEPDRCVPDFINVMNEYCKAKSIV